MCSWYSWISDFFFSKSAIRATWDRERVRSWVLLSWTEACERSEELSSKPLSGSAPALLHLSPQGCH
jgi:hypothetical protein